MRVITGKKLAAYWQLHPDAEQPLRAWYHHVAQATWRTPDDVKRDCASASILPDNRVVFNIKGNSYRLVVKIEYRLGQVYIRFVGTHREYDEIDAATI